MAMQIIDRGPLRAELALRGADAQAQALQGGLFMVAQGIDQYRKELEREKQTKIAVMTAVASKYGFNKLGPDFMNSFESMTGMQFPRDDKGVPFMPMTDEEAWQAQVGPIVQQELNSPRGREMLLAKAGYMQKPRPQAEIDLDAAKEARQEKHQSTMEAIAAMNARANMIRATRAGGATSSRLMIRNEPSGMMIDPENKGVAIPWDGKGVQLKQYEFDSMLDERKIRKAEADALVGKIKSDTAENNSANRAVKDLLTLAGDSRRKVSDEAKAAAAETLKVRHGIDIDKHKDDRTFWQKLLRITPNVATQEPAVSGAIRATEAASAPSGQKMDDASLTQLIQKRLSEGMNPADILEQAPDKYQAFRILQDLGAAQ